MQKITIKKLSSSHLVYVEKIIIDNINKIGENTYTTNILNEFKLYGNQKVLNERSKEIDYYVGILKGTVIGIIGIKKNEVKTFFVKYNLHNKGYGGQLLNFIKDIAKNNGEKKLSVNALINSVEIYNKLGFSNIKLVELTTAIKKIKYIAYNMEIHLDT